MPKITIDRCEVEVPEGATILDAARKLGIDIPTLCFLDGYPPSTSCLACIVKLADRGKLVPSCATAAVDGMAVESETPEVHDVRRTTLELLLSDHLGDCFAPCDFGCPAHMNIPQMLRQIAAEDLRGAIETVKRDIALPAVLGRVCPAPCEKACRRAPADGAVAICLLKRYVADVDLASDDPYLPECEAPTGKRVAVAGGGPTGLAAAYYLLRAGHAVTLFEKQPVLGGQLRRETTEEELPRDVLDAEIAQITRLGPEVRLGTSGADRPSLAELAGRFDAVLLACGATDQATFADWGLKSGKRGAEIDRDTFETSSPGVFAAGNAVRTKGLVIRSAADGKEAAASIGRFLAGRPTAGPGKRFSSRMGRLDEAETTELMAGADPAPRTDPEGAAGYAHDEAVRQAARCLHCDCRALATCKLKRYAEEYGADPKRYGGERASFCQSRQHAEVIYEPGKCIRCGLCIEIAARAQEPLGLTFIGRGFDVRVGVPFDRTLQEALSRVAAECVAACPTAALAWKGPSPEPAAIDAS